MRVGGSGDRSLARDNFGDQARLPPLGGAVLAGEATGSPFGDPEVLLEVDDHPAATLRGQYFPRLISFSMSLSSVRSATIFFSWLFCFSRCFSLATSWVAIP